VVDERAIGERYRLLNAQGVLDERMRRLWAAAEARSAGHGGLAAVVRATGISESTVLRGLADLDSERRPAPGNVRRHPGRTPILEREPGLEEDLERLVDPVTRGDPESPLRWTSKSGAKLAEALGELGHDVVERTVVEGQGVQPAGEQEDQGGVPAPGSRRAVRAHRRDRQRGASGWRAGDQRGRKKRELVGDFKAVGRELQPKRRPVEVCGHDFKDKQLGHAIPYGVYDLANDEGWVSVGITSDTAQFAVNSIINW
jgi:Rhodopirellula transposase DDE domain